MTAAIKHSLAIHRLWWALGGLFLALLAGFTVLQLRSVPAKAEDRMLIAPARAAALIDATTGTAATAVKAVGEDAKLINAAMPFDRTAVGAARPFDMASDSGLDHRRALLCLTQAVYYEAGFEPVEGRRAVAQVVLNRMRHPAFPKSVCGVVYQGSRSPVCQFSFVCDGALYRRPDGDAWREAQSIAAAALSGFVETAVGSATHYHADYVAPRWAPMLAKVAKLGAHIFYRWPGVWGQQAAFTGRYIGEPNDPLALRPPLRTPALNGMPGMVAGEATAVTSGPPIARAANDVGGMLDTSKGWTLDIPLPSDSAHATRTIAEQQQKSNTTPAPGGSVTASAAPVLASR